MDKRAKSKPVEYLINSVEVSGAYNEALREALVYIQCPYDKLLNFAITI
jgi:hypothetical protein